MTREEWLRDRKNYIGASEIAAVLGLDQHRTPLDVWKSKVYESFPETSEPSGRAAAGIRFEDAVAQWVADKFSLTIRRDNKIRIHPQHPFISVNLDRIIVNRPHVGVLEIKTTSKESFKTWSINSDYINPIFMHHWVQIQMQMEVSGYSWGCFGVQMADSYYGFGEPELLEIEKDMEFIPSMVDKVVEFWEKYVLTKEPPPPQTVDDMLYLYPKAGPPPVEVHKDVYDAVVRLKSIKDRKAPLEKEEKALADQIKMLFGQSDSLIFEGNIIATYKNNKDKEVFDIEVFEQEKPEEAGLCVKPVIDEALVEERFPMLYRKYIRQIPGDRRFLVKIKDEQAI
jgi:putative phage-type endonuclease